MKTTSGEWNNIIFEKRNKAYGAYESAVQTAEVDEGTEIRTTLAVGPSGPSEVTTEARSLATVDIAPQFPGGIEKFYAYMNRMVRYSEQARRNGITGKLFVSFIVAADGSVESIKILKGLEPGLDRQVIDALEQCPPWSPGKIGGIEVSILRPEIFRV